VDILEPDKRVADHEFIVSTIVFSLLLHTARILIEVLEMNDLEQLQLAERLEYREEGIPDIAVTFKGRPVFIMELKRPRVNFSTEPVTSANDGTGTSTAFPMSAGGATRVLHDGLCRASVVNSRTP